MISLRAIIKVIFTSLCLPDSYPHLRGLRDLNYGGDGIVYQGKVFFVFVLSQLCHVITVRGTGACKTMVWSRVLCGGDFCLETIVRAV